MSTTNPIPPTHKGIIPHLTCTPCAAAIEFYVRAFGAEERLRMPMPDGSRIMHAEIAIDGKVIFLHDDFPEYRSDQTPWSPKALGGTPVIIHQYVADCDAAIKRAADAGATISMPPSDMFWGDRYGMVTDPFGHVWAFATHVRELSPQEIEAAAQAAFSGGG